MGVKATQGISAYKFLLLAKHNNSLFINIAQLVNSLFPDLFLQSILQFKVLIYLPFLSSAVYILLGAGGLMMIVGFFGCFGAVRESQCLLASVG